MEPAGSEPLEAQPESSCAGQVGAPGSYLRTGARWRRGSEWRMPPFKNAQVRHHGCPRARWLMDVLISEFRTKYTHLWTMVDKSVERLARNCHINLPWMRSLPRREGKGGRRKLDATPACSGTVYFCHTDATFILVLILLPRSLRLHVQEINQFSGKPR